MKKSLKYETRRSELLEQIRPIIQKYGYENIKVRTLCKELNLSVGSFYHYFPEKNDLAELFYQDMDDYLTSITYSEDETSNLLTLVHRYAEKTEMNGVEACQVINLATFKEGASVYLRDERKINRLISTILNQGIKKKQFKEDLNVEEITAMILVILRGYNSDWAKHNGDYKITEKLVQCIQLLMHSIVSA